MHSMIWPVLSLILVGLAISLPVTALLVRLGHAGGLLDTQGAAGHVKKLRPIPNIGGIAIYLAVAVPLAVGLAAVWLVNEQTLRSLGLGAVIEHLPRIRETTPTAIAMLVCMTVLHVVGLFDDRKSLGPVSKFAAQFLVAA